MCALDKVDYSLFNMSFDVYNQDSHYIEIKTKSGQYYCVYKEDEDLIVLLHKHRFNDQYHIHYMCEDTGKALGEIMQHERYLEKKKANEKRICRGRKVRIVL